MSRSGYERGFKQVSAKRRSTRIVRSNKMLKSCETALSVKVKRQTETKQCADHQTTGKNNETVKCKILQLMLRACKCRETESCMPNAIDR